MTAESSKAKAGPNDAAASARPGGPAPATDVRHPARSQQAGGGAAGRKTIVGKVAGDKMRKTRTIHVTRLEKDGRYGKYIRRRTAYYAHDEAEVSHEGDTVLIEETRPISRSKRWRVIKVLSQGSGLEQLSHEVEENLAAEGTALERGEVAGSTAEGGAQT